MEIFVVFYFDAAHRLPQVSLEHKCNQTHGHTFRVEIHLKGELDEHKGWIMDFSQVKQICQPYIDRLDHSFLNEIEGLENPTSEIIAIWLWNKIKPQLPGLTKVVVQESPNLAAVYRGEQE